MFGVHVARSRLSHGSLKACLLPSLVGRLVVALVCNIARTRRSNMTWWVSEQHLPPWSAQLGIIAQSPVDLLVFFTAVADCDSFSARQTVIFGQRCVVSSLGLVSGWRWFHQPAPSCEYACRLQVSGSSCRASIVPDKARASSKRLVCMSPRGGFA